MNDKGANNSRMGEAFNEEKLIYQILQINQCVPYIKRTTIVLFVHPSSSKKISRILNLKPNLTLPAVVIADSVLQHLLKARKNDDFKNIESPPVAAVHVVGSDTI